jgi:hypothetical protein
MRLRDLLCFPHFCEEHLYPHPHACSHTLCVRACEYVCVRDRQRKKTYF